MNNESTEIPLAVKNPSDFGYALGKYINTSLDETYKLIPMTDLIETKELPLADFEVREALLMVKISTEALRHTPILSKIFSTNEYKNSKETAMNCQAKLRDVINSSPEHMAAFKRLMDAARKLGTGMDIALSSYLKETIGNQK